MIVRAAWIVVVAGCASATADPAAKAPPPAKPAPVPDGCHGDLDEVTPPGARRAVSFLDGRRVRSDDLRMCDVPGRVVLFRARAASTKVTDRDSSSRMRGDVIVLDRAHVDHPLRGALGRASLCFDNCGGHYGGHAGCSETSGCTLVTPIAGAREIHDFPEDRSIVGDDGVAHGCSIEFRGNAFATCSTLSRFVVVESVACGPAGVELKAFVYEHDAERGVDGEDASATIANDGDLDDGAPAGDVWTYRFPAAKPGERDIVLRYDLGGSPWASLEVGGEQEPCFAWSLASRAAR